MAHSNSGTSLPPISRPMMSMAPQKPIGLGLFRTLRRGLGAIAVLGLLAAPIGLFSSACNPHFKSETGETTYVSPLPQTKANQDFLQDHKGSFQSLNGSLTLRIDETSNYSVRHSRIITQQGQGPALSVFCQFEESGRISKVELFADPQSRIETSNIVLEGSGQTWRGYLALRPSRPPYMVTAQALSEQNLSNMGVREIDETYRETCSSARPENALEIFPLAHFGRDYLATTFKKQGAPGSELLVRTEVEKLDVNAELLTSLVNGLNQQLNHSAATPLFFAQASFDPIANTLELRFADSNSGELCGHIRLSVVSGQWAAADGYALLEMARGQRWQNGAVKGCGNLNKDPLFQGSAKIGSSKYLRFTTPTPGRYETIKRATENGPAITFLSAREAEENVK